MVTSGLKVGSGDRNSILYTYYFNGHDIDILSLTTLIGLCQNSHSKVCNLVTLQGLQAVIYAALKAERYLIFILYLIFQSKFNSLQGFFNKLQILVKMYINFVQSI